jgi:putative colanic acid biosynthesis glycosyltransferase
LHDHWAITGRCAFLNNCQNWKNNCYECPQKNNYPPVRIDNARNELSNKIDFVKKMSLLGCKFISPSLHVAKSFNMQYSHIGISECRVINNGFDIDSENFISTLSLEKSDNYKRKEINDDKKRKFAVVAHDLAYDGKTDANLINSVPMHDIEIHTFGKNSPFNNDVFVNHGYISNKDDLLVHLRHMDALIFTSKVDNYPLILCECLSLGIPVVATRSEASIEVLSKVNGRVISEDELSKCLSMDKIQLCQYLYNQTLSELKARASDVFSGNMMLKEYMKIYETI